MSTLDSRPHELSSPVASDAGALATPPWGDTGVVDLVDGVVDLGDRRRLLLALVFGVDVAPRLVSAVFDPA